MRFEECGGFLIESRQSPPHGINDTLGNAGASRSRRDAADHWDLLDSLVRSGRRTNGGRFGGNQLGCADGPNVHGAGLGDSVEDELNLGSVQDNVCDILGPFRAEDDGSAAGEPGSVGGSDVVNFEAILRWIS